MDRIDNDEPPTPTPMEIESTQYGVDNVICHKCGAWIVAKYAHGARLTLWGHPAECCLFGMKCKDNSANEYERETDRAALDIHRNSAYRASIVPKTLITQKLKASGIPSYIFQSKFPKHMSLVVELDKVVRQKMRGFDRRNTIQYKKKKANNNNNNNNNNNKNNESACVDKSKGKGKHERILKAKQLANRMECEDEKGVFQALVCIVCDRAISLVLSRSVI